ncbi:MAG: ROK family protein [Planctomycetota bacterium]
MTEAIGIDIGGTRIKALAVGVDGALGESLRRPTVDDPGGLVDAVREILEVLGEPSVPVGIAAPGLAAKDHRSIAWMRGRMEALEGLDWSEALGRPVQVLNDAHAATLAEAWCGAASGRQDVVMLTLGTGVGGGLLLGGKLVTGGSGRAGHLGHITIDQSGPADIVGTPGSLEDLVGDHTVQARTGFASTRELVEAVGAGDEAAAAHWHNTIHALACGVAGLINAFDPEAVVLGGGIATADEALFVPLREAMDTLEWRPFERAVPLLPAALGDVAGAVGAGRFAWLHTQQENGS